MIDLANSTDLPSVAPITGVPREQVDPRTLQIIDHLFPAHHGLDFLARLLGQAQVKQLALPNLGLSGVVDVAVISSAKSLRELAELIGRAYDTVQRFVSVFCRLHFLQKQRSREGITLYFPLSCPPLPEPEALDQLMIRRSRSRSFFSGVKERLILLRKRLDFLTLARSPQPLTTGGDGLNPLLGDIRQIVKRRVDSGEVSFEIGKSLIFQIEATFHHHYPQEKRLLLDQQDRFPEPKADSVVVPSDSSGLLLDQQDRFPEPKADSVVVPSDSSGLLLDQQDRFPEPKADSVVVPSDSSGLLLDQQDRFPEPKADSREAKSDFQVDSMPSIDIDSITILESISMKQIKITAKYLCHIFNEPPKRQGIYTSLYDRQGYQNPDAWLAATIRTLVAIHSPQTTTIRQPGGYFIDLCKKFHEKIPTEATRFADQYKSFTYSQLQEILQGTPSSKVVQKPPNTRRSPAQGITLRIPRLPKDRQGMSRDTIKNLTDMIKANTQTKNMRYEPYKQDDGSGILLVEDWVGCQRWICSLEEWHAIVPAAQRSVWPPKDTENYYEGAD